MRITNKAIAAKIEEKCGHKYDPGYISAVRTGNRQSPELLELIQQAIKELTGNSAG